MAKKEKEKKPAKPYELMGALLKPKSAEKTEKKSEK
jgi:hypothetical protein